MNDRLRMLASRYYSGVWVTSIDCLTKYRIHAHNFFCASMSDEKYTNFFLHDQVQNQPPQSLLLAWQFNRSFFFVKLANLTFVFIQYSVFVECSRGACCASMYLK